MFFPADIQGVISKMNPELLKSVIGSVEQLELKSNAGKFPENGDAMALNPSTLKHHESVFPPAFGYEKNLNFRHRCSDTDLNTNCVFDARGFHLHRVNPVHQTFFRRIYI